MITPIVHTRSIGLAFGASVIMALSAQIIVPFWPVPMTMQTAALFSIGVVLSPDIALGAILLYLMEGSFGLPVFAGGHAGLFVPSGGYLLAFPFAIYVVSWFCRVHWSFLWLILAFLIGECIIYIGGLPWLQLYTHNWYDTISLGLLPFLFPDLVKLLLVAIVLCSVKSLQH